MGGRSLYCACCLHPPTLRIRLDGTVRSVVQWYRTVTGRYGAWIGWNGNGTEEWKMNAVNEFALYATLHSNAIGYLYELCAKQKVEAPKITCLASAPGEYVLRMTAFSLQHTGIGARKNEAKTIAACKILIQLGYLRAPGPKSIAPSDQREEPPLPSIAENVTLISEPQPKEGLPAESACTNNSAVVAPPSLSSLAAPAFNPDNPLLSVNWILRNADKTLAQVEYGQLTPQNDSKDLWKVVCTAGEYSVSASAQSKRRALVTAGESMYAFLLSNTQVQDLLRKFEQSMVKKAPVKKARPIPPNWGVFRHRLFLPGQVMHQSLLQHNGWEDEVAAPSGGAFSPAEKKLDYLASQMGFACRVITWPQGQHFFRSKKRKLMQQETTENKEVLLSLFVTFRANKQALSFHGQGPSAELAKETAAEGALRYFALMARAASAT